MWFKKDLIKEALSKYVPEVSNQEIKGLSAALSSVVEEEGEDNLEATVADLIDNSSPERIKQIAGYVQEDKTHGGDIAYVAIRLPKLDIKKALALVPKRVFKEGYHLIAKHGTEKVYALINAVSDKGTRSSFVRDLYKCSKKEGFDIDGLVKLAGYNVNPHPLLNFKLPLSERIEIEEEARKSQIEDTRSFAVVGLEKEGDIERFMRLAKWKAAKLGITIMGRPSGNMRVFTLTAPPARFKDYDMSAQRETGYDSAYQLLVGEALRTSDDKVLQSATMKKI